MQKDTTKYIGPKGIKWYYENEPETFKTKLFPWIARSKFKDATIKTQINEIYHSVRNEAIIPIHKNVKYSANKGAKLFDDSPFYSNKLKRALELLNK